MLDDRLNMSCSDAFPSFDRGKAWSWLEDRVLFQMIHGKRGSSRCLWVKLYGANITHAMITSKSIRR